MQFLSNACEPCTNIRDAATNNTWIVLWPRNRIGFSSASLPVSEDGYICPGEEISNIGFRCGSIDLILAIGILKDSVEYIVTFEAAITAFLNLTWRPAR